MTDPEAHYFRLTEHQATNLIGMSEIADAPPHVVVSLGMVMLSDEMRERVENPNQNVGPREAFREIARSYDLPDDPEQ